MEYEVIVVGGGHAGCEASLACARKNHKTLLVTGNIKNIADLMVVAIEKKVDWNNFYLSAKRYPTIKKIKGYKQDRQVKFIQNTILNNFSIKLSEEVRSKILENTIAHFE